MYGPGIPPHKTSLSHGLVSSHLLPMRRFSETTMYKG